MRTAHIPALLLVTMQAVLGPAAAEEHGKPFLELMSSLPDSAFSNRADGTAEFVNYEAAARVADILATAQPGAVGGDARRIQGGPFANAPPGANWAGTVGFGPEDLRAAVLLRAPPDDRMALLLAPDAVAGVGPALLANGYAASEDKGFPAFWRGDKDLALDLAARNPDDPFAFDMPVSSRIAMRGDFLLQAASWPGLQSMVGNGEPGPVVTALAQAVNLPDWGSRELVQAMVFSDPMLFAPGIKLDKDLMPTQAPPGTLPYWSNLLLADLSDGQGDLTLVVLLYVAKSDAEAAAQVLEAGWDTAVLASAGGRTLGELAGTGTARVVGDGPFLAIYAVETEPEIKAPDMLRNRGYHVLMTAAYRRELSLLGPVWP